ncbi:MAG TPA: M15 family metallopeptidase [Microthrixaceae bacterium]|nr:M15 family metallopeptidase [Microthrixaceae bacterium]
MLNADPAPIRAVAGPSRVAAVMSALVSVLVLVAVVPATAQAGPPTTTTVSATPSTVPPSTPDDPSPADSADVVSASRDQVRARVAALDEQTRAAEAAAAEAQGRVDAARARAADAQAKADQAAAAAAEATEQVRSYAVEAFVRPPAQDSLSTLAIEESRDAAYATDMLHIVAERRRRVVDTMTAARVVAEQDRAAASTAADAASAEAEQARTQVESLRSARAQQSRLASQLDDRLDRMLAEAAALREVDSRAAQEITAQEVALRTSGPATPAAPSAGVPVAAQRPAPGAPAPTPTGPGPTAPAPTPTTRPPTTPVTTVPPTAPSGGTGLVTWSDVTKAGGIWVNKSIAGQVSGLVAAAKAAGINLSGGGYRDPAEQITLRRAHCGTSDYAIYWMPASQCHPPTAQPGRSMHERGLALDLMSNGRLITSRSDPAFVWLAANAGRFGFRNLPSEPWHWSTNGS